MKAESRSSNLLGRFFKSPLFMLLVVAMAMGNVLMVIGDNQHQVEKMQAERKAQMEETIARQKIILENIQAVRAADRHTDARLTEVEKRLNIPELQ